MPTKTTPIQFKYFTQPGILQAIGHVRLPLFLQAFAADLKAASLLLPAPPDPDGPRIPDPAPGSPLGLYFASVAALLSIPERLPERLRTTLVALEAAASPESDHRLQDAIQRRIPCISLTGHCPLDRALELWFACPDELSQFASNDCKDGCEIDVRFPGVPDTNLGDGQLATGVLFAPKSREGGAFENQNSKFKNGEVAPPPAASGPSPLDTRPSDSPTPWPDPVDGKLLLDALTQVLNRFVVLQKWAPEALALWIVHTFAFQLREVSSYIGIESPEKRCGKTTLLTVLAELVNRPVAASNISPPAFFRVIEDLRPTLLIDEADTFLNANEPLKGILNSGYKKKTAFVFRTASQAPSASEERDGERMPTQNQIRADGPNLASPSPLREEGQPALHRLGEGGRAVGSDISSRPSYLDDPSAQVKRFSSWCPKAIATIGRLPDTLADRCIVIRMHRKTGNEACERLRTLDAEPLRRQCVRFVRDHSRKIADATPQLPSDLSDRAADIWEPLFALADLAGGDWPERARQAAVSLTAGAQESSPIGSLLLDIFIIFTLAKTERLLSRELIASLNAFGDRPWMEIRQGKAITDRWLSQQLRPYSIKPRSLRVGEMVARGYLQADFLEAFRRYIPRSELDSLRAEPLPDTQNTAPAPP